MASCDDRDPATADNKLVPLKRHTSNDKDVSPQEQSVYEDLEADANSERVVTGVRENQLPTERRPQRPKTCAAQDNDNDGAFIPAWIRVNFPDVTHDDELRQHCADSPRDGDDSNEQQQKVDTMRAGSSNCDECNSRRAVLVCADCKQLLCFACTDAIHIIPSLALHGIKRNTVKSAVAHDDQASDTTKLQPPAAPIASPRSHATPAPVRQPDRCPQSLHYALLAQVDPTMQAERHAHLAVGTRVFFRADDVGRWPRELLHGTIVHDASARSDANNTFYYRVLWLRGVEALANGFFRASLTLATLSTSSYWSHVIGVFPTQLGALRAVVTAEAIARTKYRRELASGRLDVTTFPSDAVLAEVLDETFDALGAEYHVRLTARDDMQFLKAVSKGDWDVRSWLIGLGRDAQVREEDATTYEAQLRQTSVWAPWQPTDRMRLVLVDQHALVFPAAVRTQQLTAVIAQLLHVYVGFAWQRWRRFVKRSRRYERQQQRNSSATCIQRWLRHCIAEHLRGGSNSALLLSSPSDSPVLALQLYRRRQLEAAKLYAFLIAQCRERQRDALQRWAAAADLDDPAVQHRLTVHAPTTWHPSHDIKGLPTLPRVFAHTRCDGRVAVDDAARFEQFRATHAGPTDTSYWIVRSRVLAGTYPVGRSFSDARRIVARADYTTSVLLQAISVFVCLADVSELKAVEREHVGDAPPTESTAAGHTWLYERVVRAKHEALQRELQGAVKMAQRLVQLATHELGEYDASNSSEADAADASQRETLSTKVVLAQQNVDKAQRALDALPLTLAFEHISIPRDGVPAAPDALDALLQVLEDALRAHRNVYVFSIHGHGRTGVVAALLLGRLYGLTARDALERAQRLHDCQWSLRSHGATRSFASPQAAVQIAAVERLLAPLDAIYAPVVRESSAALGVHDTRAQQRGVAVDAFQHRDGYMISNAPDAAASQAQQHDYMRLQRIAKRESAAAALVRARRLEAAARDAMTREDSDCVSVSVGLEEQPQSRRASHVMLDLAMVGAATAALDDLVRAVELRVSCDMIDGCSVSCSEQAGGAPVVPGDVTRVIAALVDEVAETASEQQDSA